MTGVVKKDKQEEIVTDPVCGMEKSISEMKAKSKYEGKTYYFCTDGDKKMFEAHPEHWIPKEEGGGGERE